ncbi:MAG: NADH-quinone oxidoreductase subunit A [Verrucomicrobia bacterium]|nr:NADH-quinone oxidoreductase subunit A [Verrucomicrobiota bacterium]
MIREFIPVLFSLGMALAVALGGIGLGIVLGKVGRRNRAKDMAYECGKDPVGSPSARFSVKFYLVAMIFILFDIEVIFMYPWAVSLAGFRESGLGWQVFGLMMAFVLLVEVGHLYAYKKGVFDWNKRG